jgi:hypothetical protein
VYATQNQSISTAQCDQAFTSEAVRQIKEYSETGTIHNFTNCAKAKLKETVMHVRHKVDTSSKALVAVF